MTRRLMSSMGVVLVAIGCGGGTERATPVADLATSGGDAAFTTFVHDFLADTYRRQPTMATQLGVHDFDDRLEDYSRVGVDDAVGALKRFRARLADIAPKTLSPANQLDREQIRLEIDSELLTLEVIRPWATQPDTYSSGLTSTAYIMIKRQFAPADVRLRKLIAREKAMPAALAAARQNLQNPPRVATDIALQQLDGNRAFFADAVAAAFPEVKDPALLAEFKQANDAVISALTDYGAWLQGDLLKRSNGEFAIGAETYRRKLAADEMIDLPLERLLAIAEADLRKNKAAFVVVARQIDATKTPLAVLAQLSRNHPPAGKLIEVTQSELAAIARFMADHHIVTIPRAASAQVQETPPFLRASTTAAMDTPGPYETVATEAYYSVTLPDPTLKPAQVEEFMAGWHYPLITNVSVHEVWPGHYLQFLYARDFPSDVRKVFRAASNSEGWAHYAEQMVVDEGFHADDPRYRLAQIQDALLRDVRFIVGIRMHTQAMTVAQAEDMFVNDGYQTRPVAVSESKRATSDPTYGYYTMGKLMIQKLREDYKAKKAREGAPFSLQEFHDSFIKLGPLPLPLIRTALLGESGQPF